MARLRDTSSRSYEVAPEDVGPARADSCTVKGGTPAENAAAMRGVLGGERGALRDVVLLNAAAALVAADIAADLPKAYRWPRPLSTAAPPAAARGASWR